MKCFNVVTFTLLFLIVNGQEFRRVGDERPTNELQIRSVLFSETLTKSFSEEERLGDIGDNTPKPDVILINPEYPEEGSYEIFSSETADISDEGDTTILNKYHENIIGQESERESIDGITINSAVITVNSSGIEKQEESSIDGVLRANFEPNITEEIPQVTSFVTVNEQIDVMSSIETLDAEYPENEDATLSDFTTDEEDYIDYEDSYEYEDYDSSDEVGKEFDINFANSNGLEDLSSVLQKLVSNLQNVTNVEDNYDEAEAGVQSERKEALDNILSALDSIQNVRKKQHNNVQDTESSDEDSLPEDNFSVFLNDITNNDTVGTEAIDQGAEDLKTILAVLAKLHK